MGWGIILLIYYLSSGPGTRIDPLFLWLLIPFIAQDIYDLKRKH